MASCLVSSVNALLLNSNSRCQPNCRHDSVVHFRPETIWLHLSTSQHSALLHEAGWLHSALVIIEQSLRGAVC
jgi:hypothetical protein